MNASKTYSSEEFGWNMILPDGFVRTAFERLDSAGSETSAAVLFHYASSPDIQFLWQLIEGREVEEEAATRFLHVLDCGNPVNIRVLTNVIQQISPLLGDVVESEIVLLADGTPAVKVVELLSTGLKCCQFVFPTRRRRVWHAHNANAFATLPAVRDPYQKGIIFSYRMEKVIAAEARLEAITLGETSQFQRIILKPSAHTETLLPTLTQSVLSFEHTDSTTVQASDRLNFDAPHCEQMLNLIKKRTEDSRR